MQVASADLITKRGNGLEKNDT